MMLWVIGVYILGCIVSYLLDRGDKFYAFTMGFVLSLSFILASFLFFVSAINPYIEVLNYKTTITQNIVAVPSKEGKLVEVTDNVRGERVYRYFVETNDDVVLFNIPVNDAEIKYISSEETPHIEKNVSYVKKRLIKKPNFFTSPFPVHALTFSAGDTVATFGKKDNKVTICIPENSISK